MPVPNHIRRFRDSHRITAAELAAALHVSPSALSRWETGEREVSDEHKSALAAYFNVPVQAIFDFDYHPLADALHRTLDIVTSLRHRVDRLESELAIRKAS